MQEEELVIKIYPCISQVGLMLHLKGQKCPPERVGISKKVFFSRSS